jgi:hypothetical protein
MPMDPIGPRPAGMDNLEPAPEADVKGAQGPETSGRTGGEDLALRADDRPEASLPKLAEAGGERLGEAKFQGMRVRENIQSSALDPALYYRPLEGMEVQDKLHLGDAQPETAASLQASAAHTATPEAKAAPSIRVNENLRQPEAQKIWGESVKSDPASQGKLETHDPLHAAQPAASMVGSKLEGQADAFVRVSENLQHARSQNIWGESVKTPSLHQEGLEIQKNLQSPSAVAQNAGHNLESRAAAEAELKIQENLRSPNQVATSAGTKLAGQAEAKAELEIHENLKPGDQVFIQSTSKPKTGRGD